MPGIGAPPPPLPDGSIGSAPPPPPPPGLPKLSLGGAPAPVERPAEKPALPKGLHIRVAENLTKAGAKPAVKPGEPGKPAPVLRKRPALGVLAKAGIAVAAVAIAVSGIFAYKIFRPPPPPPPEPIKIQVVAKPTPDVDVKKAATDLLAKVVAAPGKLVDSGQNALAQHRQDEQDKVDAAANGDDVTPTPPPDVMATQSEMAPASINKDVKANITRIDSTSAASADFRAFVANANIGGVFQGVHSRALINGQIIREGEIVDDSLGITFDHINADKKVIYFKDGTGAEVSKNY
jgi:hypothetical protein